MITERVAVSRKVSDGNYPAHSPTTVSLYILLPQKTGDFRNNYQNWAGVRYQQPSQFIRWVEIPVLLLGLDVWYGLADGGQESGIACGQEYYHGHRQTP